MSSSTLVPTIIILLTLAAYVIIGLVSARKVKSAGAFLIAGGQLGVIPLVGTYIATFLSAVTVLGVPSGLLQNGMSYLWLLVSFSIGACLTAVVAMRYRRVNLTTPADFFMARYRSARLEQIASYGSVFFLLFSLVAQFTAMGIIWSLALGRSYTEGIIISSILMIVIITAGGLLSVAWSDVMKAGIFLVAVIVAGIFILVHFGGFSGLVEGVAVQQPDFANLKDGMGGFLGVFFLFLNWGLGIATHPQYLQRMSAAKDEKTAMKQYVLGWPLLTIVNIGITLVGFAAIATYGTGALPEGITRDYIGPYTIQQIAPTWVYGLFLAGLTAAALSTADSVIQLCVGFITKNIVKGKLKPDISDKSILSLSRIFSVVLVVLVGLLASGQWSFITYIAAYCWGGLAILYFAPTFLGLYWKRANTKGALWAVIGGLVAFGIAQTLAAFSLWPFPEVPPTGVGVLASIALMIIVSFVTKPMPGDVLAPFFDKNKTGQQKEK